MSYGLRKSVDALHKTTYNEIQLWIWDSSRTKNYVRQKWEMAGVSN